MLIPADTDQALPPAQSTAPASALSQPVSSTTSTVPHVDPVTVAPNVHSMVTRSKNNIHRPKQSSDAFIRYPLPKALTALVPTAAEPTKMENAKPCTSPMASNCRLTSTDGTPFEDISLYRSIVGMGFIATDMNYAHLEHMVLQNVKQIVGFRFLGASQAFITFTNREFMKKELVNGSSVLETSFSHLKPWKKGAKAIDRFVWVSTLGLPLIGWNRRCIISTIQKVGKMVGYDITSVSQGSLTRVKVLLSTTSFETLNEHVLLVLDGDEFEISIMEMKLDFSTLLSIIKHSMDAIGIQIVDEESCNEFESSDDVMAAGTKITDPCGDRWAMDITLTEKQKADTDSDFSLILYQGHTGPTNNLDHTNTISKITYLFPKTKETHNL
ncbi:hypothetical protein POTOM_027294 [Populus tomentosa]|uniref:DUF4283 domain-containing protein n=1 Tax=Populus tomentosa TaxID=118781 RepID=A0A8X8CVW5_POPTO|nr:hypothetical protein POTOM_027294 [Populus tomentosa]